MITTTKDYFIVIFLLWLIVKKNIVYFILLLLSQHVLDKDYIDKTIVQHFTAEIIYNTVI